MEKMKVDVNQNITKCHDEIFLEYIERPLKLIEKTKDATQ